MNAVAPLRVESVALPDGDRMLERVSFALRRIQKTEDLRSIESRMQKTLAGLFREQGAAFLVELEKMRGYFTEAPPEQAYGPGLDRAMAQTHEGFVAAIDKGVGDSVKKGAKRFTDDLGMDVAFDLKNPRAVEYLRGHAGELVASEVDATTKKYIRTLMTKSVDEGWSYDQTARALKDRYSQFAVGMPQQHIDSRAHLIATTEAAFGYENGNALMAAELVDGGIPMEKHWLTVQDNRVDSTCAGNESAGWLPSEEAFPSGDMQPPEHPACRCTTQYQVAPLEGEVAEVPPGPVLADMPKMETEADVKAAFDRLMPLVKDELKGVGKSYWNGAIQFLSDEQLANVMGSMTEARRTMAAYVPSWRQFLIPKTRWFARTAEQQWGTLIHEAIHSYTSQRYVRQTSKMLMEGVTEGWTRAFIEKMTGQAIARSSYPTYVQTLDTIANAIGMEKQAFYNKLVKLGRGQKDQWRQAKWIRDEMNKAGVSGSSALKKELGMGGGDW